MEKTVEWYEGVGEFQPGVRLEITSVPPETSACIDASAAYSKSATGYSR